MKKSNEFNMILSLLILLQFLCLLLPVTTVLSCVTEILKLDLIAISITLIFTVPSIYLFMKINSFINKNCEVHEIKHVVLFVPLLIINLAKRHKLIYNSLEINKGGLYNEYRS